MKSYNYDNNLSVRIYVIYHKPYISLLSNVFTPISGKDYGLNILTSDTGENIANENSLYAEYTTFYWAWKNDSFSKYIGFFHYRRYLCFEKEVKESNNILNSLKWDYNTLEKLLNEYDLILPPKTTFQYMTVYSQFKLCHGNDLIDKAIEVIKDIHPEYTDSLEIVMDRNDGYFCNLFISKREIFDDYMEFVFSIFEQLKEDLKDSNNKYFAYLGERLFSVYVEYLRSVSSVKICEVPLIFIGNNDNSYSIEIKPVI